MKNKKIGLLVCGVFFVGGCTFTEPGEKTGIGAATGGAMGGTIGAIIGNQTGSTSTGLVVGALAGAATGAAVGNELEGQEKAVKSQDQLIDRHEQAIAAQGNEINSLRQASRDSISFRGDSRVASNYPSSPPVSGSAYRGATAGAYGAATTTDSAPIHETTIAVAPRVDAPSARIDSTSPSSPTQAASGRDGFAPRLSNDGGATAPAAAPVVAAASSAGVAGQGEGARAAYTWNSGNKPDLSSPDCVKAQGEVRDAAAASENADKLFHFRRALRLCPSNPEYHNSLGQVYLSLNRKSDAEFEFKEALNIDSSFEPAKQNLSNITR